MNNIPQESNPPQKPCIKCKHLLSATREFFSPDKKLRGGLKNTCKECRQKARRTSEILPEGHKRCTGCKHLLPATSQFFNADPSGKFGLRGNCRVCQSPYVHYPPAPDGHKRCSQCTKVLPATDEFFHSQKNGNKGVRGACKNCRSKESKEYEGREDIKARRRRQAAAVYKKLQRKAYALKNAEYYRQYRKEYCK